MELFNVSLLAVIFVLYNVCDGKETKRQSQGEIVQTIVESMDQMPNDVIDAVCESVCGGCGPINPTECDDSDTEAPHSMACLIKWWLNAGCSLDGTSSPIHYVNLYRWQESNKSTVQEDMAWHKKYADQDYMNAYIHCYGSEKSK